MHLQSRLIDKVDARGDADHIPLLVDMNPQVPSRIDWLINQTGEDPGPVLASMARTLETAGAEALAMPCNTAHHFAADIIAAVDIPFLDMTRLSVAAAAQRAVGSKAVGVLASKAAQDTGLFQDILETAGCACVFPDNTDDLLRSIIEIKSIGPERASIDALQGGARQLEERGVDTVLIACSEFSMIAQRLSTTVAAIDTVEILADHIVSFARGIELS